MCDHQNNLKAIKKADFQVLLNSNEEIETFSNQLSVPFLDIDNANIFQILYL